MLNLPKPRRGLQLLFDSQVDTFLLYSHGNLVYYPTIVEVALEDEVGVISLGIVI